MRDESEGIGIALEMRDILPEVAVEHWLEFLSLAFCEEGLKGFLARMAEWRITHVVSQTGGGDDSAKFLDEGAGEFGIATDDILGNIVSEGHTDACHLEGVREAVVYEYASRQREYLCLVLHTTEWSREYQSVVVALELRTVIVPLEMSVLLSETLD